MDALLAWPLELTLLGAQLLGLHLWIPLLRSENGERYLRQRNQGPFVPSGEEKNE